MTLPTSIGQNVFVGAFDSESDALTEIRAKKWDSNSDGTGNPQNGMTAIIGTSSKALYVYIDGWLELATI